MSIRDDQQIYQESRERMPYRRDSVVTMADDDEMVSAEDGHQQEATDSLLGSTSIPLRRSPFLDQTLSIPRRMKTHNVHVPCRLVNKDGSYHIQHLGAPDAPLHYWRNLILSLIEIRWRWVWLTVFCMYPASWLSFTVVFYAIAYHHGDFDNQTTTDDSDNIFVPCVGSVNDFVSMFLFSIESQQTIGYGYRYSTDRCGLLLFFLGIQYIIGSVITACLCAIIWARILRPRRRAQEVLFSDRAVVTTNQDGQLCVMFRMSDTAGSHLVQTVVHLYLAIKWPVPNHSDNFSFRICQLSMGEDVGRDKLIFLWPTVVYHVINKHSALYNYSKEDFEKADLELIAVAEGIVEATGLTFQVRTSYSTKEVRWGHRFQAMNFCGEGNKGKVKIKYHDFNATFPTSTPTCSAKQLDARKINQQTSLV